MENIVYNELLVRGYNVDVGIVDVFAKSNEGKRVHKQLVADFVVNQGSQRYYIQVAYDMTSVWSFSIEDVHLENYDDDGAFARRTEFDDYEYYGVQVKYGEVSGDAQAEINEVDSTDSDFDVSNLNSC
jgi:predicted AAA+ superfamily ATPase